MKHSIIQVADISAALFKLTECLVISFDYSERNGTFLLVSDYPEALPGSDRVFASILFGAVRKVVRKPGNSKQLIKFKYEFSARNLSRPIVIQSLRFATDATRSRIDFWFGPNFGGLRFEYTTIAFYIRGAKATRTGDAFVYSDARTGKLLDFYSPFLDLNPSSPHPRN